MTFIIYLNIWAQSVSIHIKRCKNLIKSQFFAIFNTAWLVSILVDSFFDKFQQMFLVHTGRSVNVSIDFTAIVKITMRALFIV